MSRLLRPHRLQHETIQTVQVTLTLHGVSGCGAAPQHAGVDQLHAHGHILIRELALVDSLMQNLAEHMLHDVGVRV